MDLRKSLLKPFKKLKSKLPSSRRKQDGKSGSETEGRGGKSDVEGSEASQMNSLIGSEVDVRSAVESGPSRERDKVDGRDATLVDDPPTSTPSISRSGKPGGM